MDEHKLSGRGLGLLCSIEQLRLHVYDDKTGRPTDMYVAGATIGYGHLIKNQAEFKRLEDGITQEHAVKLLTEDVAEFERVVNDAIRVGVTQSQFDALVIFAYNIGGSKFATCSAVHMLNDPEYTTQFPGVEDAWKAWNRSGGKVLAGLKNRRECEWKLFTEGVYEAW